jgi:DNA-binding protein H-NS
MQTIDQIQQQINDVQAQAKAKITELQKQAEAARKAASSEAIKEVKRLIALHHLTAADIGWSGGSKSTKTKQASSDNRASVAPKYRDGETGQTWSGRGKPPTWLAAKLAAGASKESFRI